jgi:hypothetical protein
VSPENDEQTDEGSVEGKCHPEGDKKPRPPRHVPRLTRGVPQVVALERAHRLHLDSSDISRSVRCAFWPGHKPFVPRETVQASGWFTRAERQLAGHEEECVEQGYLLIPLWLKPEVRRCSTCGGCVSWHGGAPT